MRQEREVYRQTVWRNWQGRGRSGEGCWRRCVIKEERGRGVTGEGEAGERSWRRQAVTERREAGNTRVTRQTL